MLSRFYLYSFVALFIYAVLNIFIAIIEDAFITSTVTMQQQLEERKRAQEDAESGGGGGRDTDLLLGSDSLAGTHTASYGTVTSVAAHRHTTLGATPQYVRRKQIPDTGNGR